MYEIVVDGAIVEVDWYCWRSYGGERLLCGGPYSGPVMEEVATVPRDPRVRGGVGAARRRAGVGHAGARRA